MRKLLLLLALNLYCLCCWCQSGISLTGRITDANTNSVIDFADILLFKSGDSKLFRQTLPDENGRFSFSSVEAGTYSLVVRLIGYDIFTVNSLEIKDNTCINLGDVKLRPLEIGLAEVEIVADKRLLVYKLDKKIVEASSNIMGTGGSAVDVLENTPSVRVDANGEITFRGSSGFLVYVDGKPSVFSGTQALEQVPAAQIENIEIITTPSAKHDTEGEVGIINIITKKRFLEGLSGMVNLSINTWLTRRGDFLLNQQNNKSRWFVGGQWSDKLSRSNHELLQSNTSIENEVFSLDASGPQKGNRFNYSLKGGWSINLPKTSFEVSVEGGHGGRTHNGDMLYKETHIVNGQNVSSAVYNNNNDFENSEDFGQGNLALTHRFNDDGHNISVSFYYKYGGNSLEYSYNELLDMQGNRQDGMCYYEAEYRKTMRANADYALPLSDKAKLEAGYQYYSYLEDGDYDMEWWNPSSEVFEKQPGAYNTFYFREEIHSIYAILSGTFNKLDAQIGLRGEHTHTQLLSSIANASRINKRFEVFPSLHLGYSLPREQKLLLSYSYRTTRPQLWFMEPYITYNDFYSAVIGNPDIRPEYIHSFEMNYSKSFGENSVSATLFHRFRKDKIERLRVPFEEAVSLDSMANVGRDYSTGLELVINLHPTRWWNTTLNGNVYHYKVVNELSAGGKHESSINYDIMWNNLFTLGKYTRLQLDGSFVGPSVTTQGRSDSYWYANLAIRQQLFNRKLTATLAFRDIFRSACYINDINTPDLKIYTKIRPKYPQIMLTLSYTFNSFKAKSTQEKEDRNELFEGIK